VTPASTPPPALTLARWLAAHRLARDVAEAARMVTAGAIRLDGVVARDPDVVVPADMHLQVGAGARTFNLGRPGSPGNPGI
jgi:ribosomal protein S4